MRDFLEAESEKRAARRAARKKLGFVWDHLTVVTDFYHSSCSQQVQVGRKIHYQIRAPLLEFQDPYSNPLKFPTEVVDHH